jgi:hypothetical protein
MCNTRITHQGSSYVIMKGEDDAFALIDSKGKMLVTVSPFGTTKIEGVSANLGVWKLVEEAWILYRFNDKLFITRDADLKNAVTKFFQFWLTGMKLHNNITWKIQKGNIA